jgi:hypothetical protein
VIPAEKNVSGGNEVFAGGFYDFVVFDDGKSW